MKTALITGITGQDGSYMADLLLSKGYRVFGTCRHNARSVLKNIAHNRERINLIGTELTDFDSVKSALAKSEPDEIYNFAGQSYQPASLIMPTYTMDVNATGLMRIIEASFRLKKTPKIFQASAAGMFGQIIGPCSEETPFAPVTPYDVSKAAAHQLSGIYRKKGLFICNAIMFSHESPRRGLEFVTRKITQAVANWVVGNEYPLELGDVNIVRDCGWAPHFVETIYDMMQQEDPNDYVLGTCSPKTILNFLHDAIIAAGLNLDRTMKRIRYQSHTTSARPPYACTSRAERVLNFDSNKWSLIQIAEEMVKSDIEELRSKTNVLV